MRISRMHRAARAYPERFQHLKLFPCIGKMPAVPKREGGRGYLDATNDPTQIDRWWKRWPDANIGIAAGLSGLTIVDIDQHGEDGDASWADLIHGRELPEAPEVLTGGGGRHEYFTGDVGSCTLAPGVDVKAGGGYVLAPPSVHPDTGRPYVWEASSRIDEVSIPSLPAWLGERIGRRNCKRLQFTHAESVAPETFALGAAFKAAGMLGAEIRPGVFIALCPTRERHTQGDDWDSSSVVFAPPPGKTRGMFHCSHGHCHGAWA